MWPSVPVVALRPRVDPVREVDFHCRLLSLHLLLDRRGVRRALGSVSRSGTGLTVLKQDKLAHHLYAGGEDEPLHLDARLRLRRADAANLSIATIVTSLLATGRPPCC